MADTYHPRLTEILERVESAATPAEAEQEGTPPTETVTEPASDAAPVEQPTSTDTSEQAEVREQPEAASQPEPPQRSPGDDYFIQLDKRNAYAELAKLDQDPVWREHLRTFGGRKAKREYEGRVGLLEKELKSAREEAEHLRFQAELAKTAAEQGEEVIQERLRTDPEFARKYHQRPQSVDLTQEQESLSLTNHIHDLLEWGMQQGLPPQRIRQYEEALKTGFFDHPVVNGQHDKSKILSPVQSISALQAALTDDAGRFRQAMAQQQAGQQAPAKRTPPIPPELQQTAPAPKANPALVNNGPDLSDGGVSKSSDGKISLDEYKKLTPPEKLNRWPTKGLEQLINEGVVEKAT